MKATLGNHMKTELIMRRGIILQQDMHCNFSEDILYCFLLQCDPPAREEYRLPLP